MKRKVPSIQNLAEESQTLYDVLNDELDIACVLISVSYLDYALASLLKHFFIEGKTSNRILEPPSGFLSTFASRYELAYCLGLISKGLYQNLQIMGSIRNAFAHSHLMMSLDHPDIVGHIDKLTLPTIHHSITIDGDEVRHNDPPSWSYPNTPRAKFTFIVVVMVNRILLTGLATKHRDRLSKGW